MVAGLRKIKGYYDYGIFSAIQIAGIVALRHCEEDVHHQAGIYQNRRDALCEGLERIGLAGHAAPGRHVRVGQDTGTVQTASGPWSFAMRMMDQANVALAPGIGFGEEGEGYVRIALVENEHRIRQALRQMKRAMQAIEEDPAIA
jgi:alanine-synthesizing transaminase